jgi:hypothetical protein
VQIIKNLRHLVLKKQIAASDRAEYPFDKFNLLRKKILLWQETQQKNALWQLGLHVKAAPFCCKIFIRRRLVTRHFYVFLRNSVCR